MAGPTLTQLVTPFPPKPKEPPMDLTPFLTNLKKRALIILHHKRMNQFADMFFPQLGFAAAWSIGALPVALLLISIIKA